MDWIKGEFTVSMEGNMFVEHCKSGQDGMCYFIKGVMTGTIEEITHQSYGVTEVECYKNGAEKCVFKLNRIK